MRVKTMVRRSDAPDGRSAVPGVPRRLRRVTAAFAVVSAAVAGWFLAGPPKDTAVPVPPACPAGDPIAEPARPGQGAGVGDRLVPMPLPEPRGPVSVRLCRYEAGAAGLGLRTSAVLDPTRTVTLAGVLNAAVGVVVPDGARPTGCAPGPAVTVLVFAYTEGPAQQVDVLGGGCGLVSTPARVERDRQDVVRRVAEFLG